MKGLAPVAAVVFGILVVLLVGEGVVLNNVISNFETVRRSVFQSEIALAIDIVETLRAAMIKSLDYSFYQALYDVAARGGHQASTCQAYWRVYSDTFYPQKFLDNIVAQTQENLNVFGDKLQVQNTDIPEYSIRIDKSGTDVKLTATAKSKITASRDFYTVSQSQNFVKEFDIDVSKIYENSKKEFIDRQPEHLQERTSDVDKNQMPLLCKRYEQEYCEQAPVKCEDMLNINCRNADEVYREKIISAIENIGPSLTSKYSVQKISYDVGVKDSFVEHKTDEIATEVCSGGSTSCGCNCIGHTEITTKTVCSTDAEGVQSCTDVQEEKFVCDYYYKKFSLKCTYDYKGAVSAKISAADLSESYPLYEKSDNSVALRNVNLQFLVISSNPTIYKPIQIPTGLCS